MKEKSIFLPFWPKAAIGLGILNIILGTLVFTMQIVAYIFETPFSVAHSGIWMGVLFILMGVFGILSGKKKKSRYIVAFLVLAVIGILVAIALLVVSLLSGALFLQFSSEDCKHSDDTEEVCEKKKQIKFAIEMVLLTLAVIEFLLALVSSGFACGGLCCCKLSLSLKAVPT